MIPVTDAARFYDIPWQTILALGRRGLVKTVDYWTTPGGARRLAWGCGRVKRWHVRRSDLGKLMIKRRARGDYATAATARVFIVKK